MSNDSVESFVQFTEAKLAGESRFKPTRLLKWYHRALRLRVSNDYLSESLARIAEVSGPSQDAARRLLMDMEFEQGEGDIARSPIRPDIFINKRLRDYLGRTWVKGDQRAA